MTKRRKKRPKENLASDAPESPSADESKVIGARSTRDQATKSHASHPWARLFHWKTATVGIAMVLALVFFAPTIVAKTPLFPYAVAIVTADIDGQVEIKSASLGWLSGIRLTDIVVRDNSGQVMATLAEVEIDRSLLALATDSSNLGRITITKPDIMIKLDAASSNWEKALASYLTTEPDTTKSASPIAAELLVADGHVRIVDTHSQQSCEFNSVQVDASLQHDQKVTAKVETQVKQDETAGQLTASYESEPNVSPEGSSAKSLGTGTVSCTLSSLPLHAIRPLLHRFAPSIQDVSGRANGTLEATWDDTSDLPALVVKTETKVEDLTLAADQLGDDRANFEWLELAADMSAANGTLEAELCQLTTPMGHVDASGKTRLESLSTVDATRLLLDSIEFGNTKLKGRIDLAEVARLFPNTMQLRNDTTVQTGEIVWDTQADATEHGARLAGTLQTKNVTAIQNGRRISLSKPIDLTFRLLHSDHGVAVERFVGHSNFMTVEANGRMDKGRLSAVVRLDDLQAELEQLIDFSGQELAGKLVANADWQRVDESQLNANAQISATHFVWRQPNRPTWQEPRIDVTTQLKSELKGFQIRRILLGQTDVVAGKERLTVATTQPISLNGDANQHYPLHVEINGNLRNWQRRSQPFFDTSSISLAGHVDADLDATVSASNIQLHRSQTKLFDLDVDFEDQRYAERKAVIDAVGHFDMQSMAMTIPEATIASTSISARANDVNIQLSAPIAAAGNVSFRGRLDRISQLIGLKHRGMMATGNVAGRLQASQENGSVQFHGSVHADKPEWLSLTQSAAPRRRQPGSNQWQRIWDEPELDVVAEGTFNAAVGELQLKKVNINAGTARVAASGTLGRLDQDVLADIRGTTEYDWGVLTKRLQRYLGTQVRLTGKESKSFEIRGPLLAVANDTELKNSLTRSVSANRRSTDTPPIVPAALQAMGQIGWKNAHAYGLNVQRGDVQAVLNNQQIRFRSFEFPVAGGRISASPRIDLRNSSVPLLLHGQGRVIDDVRLTPDLCSKWLKYVAPLLADATAAEGLFSVDLVRARVPLYDPYRASVGGSLQIDNAQIRPGSMAKQFLDLANQIKALVRGGNASRIVNSERTLISMPPQNILFELRDGAVGHEGLMMQFGDVEVQTQGWVTLDERLQMTATIPILPKWVENQKLLRGLAGQTLEIPIAGTLRQPQLDRSAVQQLTKKAVRGAAEGLIQDELGKQLRKLFK